MHKVWSKWGWEKGVVGGGREKNEGERKVTFFNFKFRPKRKIINVISVLQEINKNKNQNRTHENPETNEPFYYTTLCPAEHMRVVSLRHFLSELLFRKSPTINLGLYHTVLYEINVPKVQLLARTQKGCFFFFLHKPCFNAGPCFMNLQVSQVNFSS